MGADPVQAGLVPSLSRPGGNITGTTNLATELGPKQLELLRELVPTATDFALLVNPDNANEGQSRDMQAAARSLGLGIHILRANTERELEAVFARFTERRIGGLVIGPEFVFQQPQRARRRADRSPCDACDLHHSRVCHSGRSDELWQQHDRLPPPGRRLRRPYSQG